MIEAVTLARLRDRERVDWALGHAATFTRFADGDPILILTANPAGTTHAADETHSLQTGTKAWTASELHHDRTHNVAPRARSELAEILEFIYERLHDNYDNDALRASLHRFS